MRASPYRTRSDSCPGSGSIEGSRGHPHAILGGLDARLRLRSLRRGVVALLLGAGVRAEQLIEAGLVDFGGVEIGLDRLLLGGGRDDLCFRLLDVL